MISDAYRAMNQEMHLDRPTYGAGGYRWAERGLELVHRHAARTVLDYGCGKGTLVIKLKRMLPPNCWIQGYDPSYPPFAGEPRPADIVLCTDVLEHIEPEHLDAVLRHLASLTKKACLCVIATRPAKKTLPDGRNAHLIVEDALWWASQLGWHFKIGGSTWDHEKSELVVELEPKA